MDIFKTKKAALDKYAALNKAAVCWRTVAITEAIAVIILAIGLVTLSNSKEIVPWVVQVDKHNFAIADRPRGTRKGGRSAPRHCENQPIRRRAQVHHRRPYSTRLAHQAHGLQHASESSSALNTTNQFYRANDPFKRYKDKRETVAVEVRTILPMGANSWRAEWTEHVFVDGIRTRNENWSGVFEVSTSAPTDVDKIKDNPLGIYVVSYSMNRDFK